MTKPWAQNKQKIIDLYAKHTLDKVMIVMQEKHKFVASRRTYRMKLDEWGCTKYQKRNKVPKSNRPRTQSPLPSGGASSTSTEEEEAAPYVDTRESANSRWPNAPDNPSVVMMTNSSVLPPNYSSGQVHDSHQYPPPPGDDQWNSSNMHSLNPQTRLDPPTYNINSLNPNGIGYWNPPGLSGAGIHGDGSASSYHSVSPSAASSSSPTVASFQHHFDVGTATYSTRAHDISWDHSDSAHYPHPHQLPQQWEPYDMEGEANSEEDG